MGLGKKLHLFLAKHNMLLYCLESCEKYGCEEYHGSSPSEQIQFDFSKRMDLLNIVIKSKKHGGNRNG
jgi:hypothetical protein